MIKNRYKKRFQNLSCCVKNKNEKLKTALKQVKSEIYLTKKCNRKEKASKRGLSILYFESNYISSALRPINFFKTSMMVSGANKNIIPPTRNIIFTQSFRSSFTVRKIGIT